MFAQRIQNIRVSPIKQIELAASKIPNSVSLAQGIPSFDTPESIKERVMGEIRAGRVSKYSLAPGTIELREAIAHDLARNGMHYDWETEIIVTAGAIEGITATLASLLNEGDEVLLPSPTYTSYQEAIKISGGVPVFVPLVEDHRWGFNFEAFEKAITQKTRAILFCNPNNPTGTIYTAEQLQQLAELAEKYNLYVLSDEVYKDFIYTDTPYLTLAQKPRYRKRVIRIFSFSKAYAMTGWRVGYIHSDASVIAEILKVHDTLITCAPVVSQYAALVALENAQEDVARFKQTYQHRRKILCERLDGMDTLFSYQVPDSSYFVFPKINVAHDTSWNFAFTLLEKIGVALVPGSAFGPEGEGHVRMSFGRDEADINEACDRLEKYMQTL